MPPLALGPDGLPLGGFPPMQVALPKVVGVRVEDGRIANSTSLDGMRLSGSLTDTYSSGLILQSDLPNLNAFYARGGATAYTLQGPQIELSGHGSDDNSGIGAGALAADSATLILRGARITTAGAGRATVTATDRGVLRIYDSILTANGGPLPEGYVRKIGPGMLEPPPPLGITGRARASNTTAGGKTYFYHSTIIADGWGAVSTDMAAPGTYAEVNDSTVKTISSGYGTYADNGAEVVFNDSRVDVASYVGIIAGDARMTFNRTTSVSRGDGVMIHSVMGSGQEIGRLIVDGGSIESAGSPVLIKSANADVTLDGVSLKAGNGLLVRSIVNDDANATRVRGEVKGSVVKLRKLSAVGGIVHSDTQRALKLNLEDARVQGSISGVVLSLDEKSFWTASTGSKVTLGAPFSVGRVDAPVGVVIEARSGDSGIAPGSYKLKGGGSLQVTR